MKRILKIILCLSFLGCLSSQAIASLNEVVSVAAANGEGGYGSAIIDPTVGFAVFGSSNPIVVGFSTETFFSTYLLPPSFTTLSYANRLANFNLVNNFTAGVFDPTTMMLYFATGQSPSVLQAVSNTLPVVYSSMTFQTGQNAIGTAVIDTTNHFAYFGTGTSPSIIVKVQIPDGVNVTSTTVISSMTLPAGLDFLSASVIDTTGGFAYFTSSTTTGAVAKIKLSDFSLAGTLIFNSGEGGVGSAVIDTTHQFAYFGTHDSPGKIVKVQLSNFTRVSAATLVSGENDLTSAVIDPAGGFAYFGTNTSPGLVIPLLLGNFNPSTALTLASGDNFLRSAVIDTVNSYAYFGTYTTPGRVIEIDLLGGLPTIVTQPSPANAHTGETASFSVVATGRNLSYQWQLNGVTILGATSATYTHVALATDDGSEYSCVVTGINGSITTSSAQLTIIPVIRAYPNPWRADRHAGVNITFDGLLPNSTVKIFNLAAHWVKTLPPSSGSVTWDRTNDAGQTVASGYYFYVVKGRTDKQDVEGKLAIIR